MVLDELYAQLHHQDKSILMKAELVKLIQVTSSRTDVHQEIHHGILLFNIKVFIEAADQDYSRDNHSGEKHSYSLIHVIYNVPIV
jgi:hypothetical protein